MSLHNASQPGLISPGFPVRQAADAASCQHVPAIDKVGGEIRMRCALCNTLLPRPHEATEPPPNMLKRNGAVAELPNGSTAHLIERRFTPFEDVKVDTSKRTFEGYGCVFDVRDSYRTRFRAGCFSRSLGEWRSAGRLPSFYWAHDWKALIGRYDDMWEDSKGLVVKGRFTASPMGDHYLQLVHDRTASGLSVGFVPIDYEVMEDDDWQKREIVFTDVDLYECSMVENPAVPGSGISAIRASMTTREIERVLIGMGAPREAAKAMASKWKSKGEEEREAPKPKDAETRDASDQALIAGIGQLIATMKS